MKRFVTSNIRWFPISFNGFVFSTSQHWYLYVILMIDTRSSDIHSAKNGQVLVNVSQKHCNDSIEIIRVSSHSK